MTENNETRCEAVDGAAVGPEPPIEDKPPVAITKRRKKRERLPVEQIIPPLVEYSKLWMIAIRQKNRILNAAMAMCRRFCMTDGLDWNDTKDREKITAAGSNLWKGWLGGKYPNLDPVLLPFKEAINPLEAWVKRIEKSIEDLAKDLPVWSEWGEGVFGLSAKKLGQVVGLAGGLDRFQSPAALWKRMGLAVIRGERQRRVSDAELAIEHGYNAERRALMWNVGAKLIDGMGHGPRLMVGEDIDSRDDLTPYQKLFLHRLRYEAEKDPKHLRPATKEGKESYSAHAANRAKRYVEKRFLRDLWRQWKRLPAWEEDPSIEFRMAA